MVSTHFQRAGCQPAHAIYLPRDSDRFLAAVGKKKYYIEVPIWNATVANLTLMALGSSAPEILLSVIETGKDIEAVPGELGPSTIVGSAAFNLLVITGVSILAVDETPKKVSDTGVFAVTSLASLFAYIWLYLTLRSWSEGHVTMLEAWLTLAFFFVLIALAYCADRINSWMEDKKKTEQEQDEQNRQDEVKIKKNQLRTMAKEYGESLIIEIAQGLHTKETAKVGESQQKEVRRLYKEILGQDLSEVDLKDLLKVLQPDSLLERFAYRKQAGMHANTKDFIKLKGSKG